MGKKSKKAFCMLITVVMLYMLFASSICASAELVYKDTSDGGGVAKNAGIWASFSDCLLASGAMAEGESSLGYITKVMDVLTDILRYAGILIIVFAMYQLILAFKDEQAEAKIRGTSLMVISVFLIESPRLLAGIMSLILEAY